MTLWEIAACVDGINTMNEGAKPAPPTDDEFDAMIAKYMPIHNPPQRMQ